MAARHREEELENFRSDPLKTVCLVSLRAGAYGLNLTCASQCVILDPFWNPFIEAQAIDRIHRIGQLRPVKVHRIVIRGTVEDRILALQEKVYSPCKTFLTLETRYYRRCFSRRCIKGDRKIVCARFVVSIRHWEIDVSSFSVSQALA